MTNISSDARCSQLALLDGNASRMVPLYLTLKHDNKALQKAIQSDDTDLSPCLQLCMYDFLSFSAVYSVLLHLIKKMPSGDFFRVLDDGGQDYQLAADLMKSYARLENRDMLKDYFYQYDMRIDSSILYLEESLASLSPSQKQTQLKKAIKFLAEDRSRAFTVQV